MTDDFDQFTQSNHEVLHMVQPQPPKINYFMALLEGLYQSFRGAAFQSREMGKYEQAMYYQGKSDAMREAMQHYRELKP